MGTSEAWIAIEKIIEKNVDGLVLLDNKLKLIYINGSAQRYLNLTGHLKGQQIFEQLDTFGYRTFFSACTGALHEQKRKVVEQYLESLGRWVGTTVSPAPAGIIVHFYEPANIPPKTGKLAETDNLYKSFIERITDGFIVLDKNFNYLYANQKVGEMVKRDPQSLIGKNLWQEFPETLHSYTYRAFQTAMKEQRFISNIDYYEPLDLWLENYIYPSSEGLSVIIKDVTDRKRLEQQLREQQRNQQFEIMITALEAQENERTYIGRELHDNVNQLLVSTKLMLNLFADDPGQINTKALHKCIQNLDSAINENRKISHELVTPNLKHEGLVEQLSDLVKDMLGSVGIEFTIAATDFSEDLLTEQQKLTVYRIAQEQCINIIKHARAKKVEITLVTTEEIFTMIVADNGIGTYANKTGKGIGLRNIEARVAFFGGNVLVETAPEKGYKLEVNFPITTKLPSPL